MLKKALRLSCTVCSVILLWSGSLLASDWPNWRGPDHNGISPEKNLISSWSTDGENLIWRADFSGRSTPVIMNGRVYVLGRVGEGIDRQARLACFDAENGNLIWEDRMNLYHTTVPFTRVGWANMVGDPETGNIYMLGVGGLFRCYNGDGKIVWEYSLTEEFWMWSGYGGRTHTPIIDEGNVILSFANYGWGEYGVWRHRYYGFDKRTGEIQWVTTPGGQPKDLNTYSIPVVAMINGERLLVAGNADGSIYAIKARTGEKVWQFRLSKRGINSSVVISGNKVYVGHSEENIDEGSLGRFVCIDATGKGDVTETHEVWRYAVGVGFSSPLIKDGNLYVVDNSANLHCFDAESGKQKWEYSLGTVGKASPVWADGKLYVPELNGRFHILKPTETECVSLDLTEIKVSAKRGAEIYASPAVAYGRVYFPTEEGLYCLGDKTKPFATTSSAMRTLNEEEASEDANITSIQIVPALILTKPNEQVKFRVNGFDAKGRFVKALKARFTLEELQGKINKKGHFKANKKAPSHIGKVVAHYNGLTSGSRVRVIPELPLSFDFENFEDGVSPPYWVGANRKYVVRTVEGNKVLVKPPAPRGLHRSKVYFGPADLSDYTIEAEILGTRNKRRRPDFGLVASGYTLDFLGGLQRLQVRSWTSVLRMAKTIDLAWEPNVWYKMKMRVDVVNEKAVIRGKVWKKSEAEPEAWTITAEDPHPVRHGSPGLYGNSTADVYYDNVKVSRSK